MRPAAWRRTTTNSSRLWAEAPLKFFRGVDHVDVYFVRCVRVALPATCGVEPMLGCIGLRPHVYHVRWHRFMCSVGVCTSCSGTYIHDKVTPHNTAQCKRLGLRGDTGCVACILHGNIDRDAASACWSPCAGWVSPHSTYRRRCSTQPRTPPPLEWVPAAVWPCTVAAARVPHSRVLPRLVSHRCPAALSREDKIGPVIRVRSYERLSKAVP